MPTPAQILLTNSTLISGTPWEHLNAQKISIGSGVINYTIMSGLEVEMECTKLDLEIDIPQLDVEVDIYDFELGLSPVNFELELS